MTEPTRIVIVHPADVHLADVKARAAEHGATVVANRYVPRGQMFVLDPAVLASYALCGATVIGRPEGQIGTDTFRLRAGACTKPKDHPGDHYADYLGDDQ